MSSQNIDAFRAFVTAFAGLAGKSSLDRDAVTETLAVARESVREHLNDAQSDLLTSRVATAQVKGDLTTSRELLALRQPIVARLQTVNARFEARLGEDVDVLGALEAKGLNTKGAIASIQANQAELEQDVSLVRFALKDYRDGIVVNDG